MLLFTVIFPEILTQGSAWICRLGLVDSWMDEVPCFLREFLSIESRESFWSKVIDMGPKFEDSIWFEEDSIWFPFLTDNKQVKQYCYYDEL